MDWIFILRVIGVMVGVSVCVLIMIIAVIAMVAQGGMRMDTEVRYPKEWKKADAQLKERIKNQWDN